MTATDYARRVEIPRGVIEAERAAARILLRAFEGKSAVRPHDFSDPYCVLVHRDPDGKRIERACVACGEGRSGLNHDGACAPRSRWREEMEGDLAEMMGADPWEDAAEPPRPLPFKAVDLAPVHRAGPLCVLGPRR